MFNVDTSYVIIFSLSSTNRLSLFGFIKVFFWGAQITSMKIVWVYIDNNNLNIIKL